MMSSAIFTSESVTAGHPDKLCDQISDAAIDAFLAQDSGARAIIECALATGIVFIAARFAAHALMDLPAIARKVIAEAGYAGGDFDARKCSILTSFVELPIEMRQPPPPVADDEAFDRIVANDQANIFGYACRETRQFMPLPITLAHRVASALDEARRGGAHWLSPDAKSQVSVEYHNGAPARIHSVSVTVAVEPAIIAVDLEDFLRDLTSRALSECEVGPDARTQIHINAGIPFDVGGPARHAGLTGRKNGIDTYGEIARQSGAALSGKDPSRIDRAAAYAARHAAKNVVAAGLADRCEIHLAYAIGQAQPISLSVETFGTGRHDDELIAKRVAGVFDFRPAAIVHRLGLRTRPEAMRNEGFYRRLATYGHFGRADLFLPWESLDLAAALRG
jgi:S-adenosylmethionine synthetase